MMMNTLKSAVTLFTWNLAFLRLYLYASAFECFIIYVRQTCELYDCEKICLHGRKHIYIYTCIIPLSPLGSLGPSIGYPRPPWATSILFGGYGLPCAPLRWSHGAHGPWASREQSKLTASKSTAITCTQELTMPFWTTSRTNKTAKSNNNFANQININKTKPKTKQNKNQPIFTKMFLPISTLVTHWEHLCKYHPVSSLDTNH